MAIRLVMGNEAIALGALRAGISVAAGYPGTPSTEILECVAKQRREGTYVEWSINEKAAFEVAAGAAYTGARTLVTMKQVGLNVASDPLMSLAYIGVKGGMVIVVADDPGPISSQTEQDTRSFAKFSKLPVFDPTSPEEAYTMIQEAFELSERYSTPVLFRPTTRLCHATASIDIGDDWQEIKPEGFVKDPKWVIFPRLSVVAHAAIERRNPAIGDELSDSEFNTLEGAGRLGIAASGVNYAYVREALAALGVQARVLKVGVPFPFPYKLATRFLDEVDSVLVVEELDPVIERELVYLGGRLGKRVTVLGKDTGHSPLSGENTVESVTARVAEYLGAEFSAPAEIALPALPVRPPVLCAGCPHRASFYAVKRAMSGKKAVFCGDIGCYTLGNAMPLDMVDTCLCMGAGITIAQGIACVEKDTTAFAFVGDSTFFASGITGIVNAVYNKNDMILIVLDNSITAMTGGQTHPGIGKTLMDEDTVKVSIPDVLSAVGVSVRIVNPLELETAIEAVRAAASETGVRAIVFEYPCVSIARPTTSVALDAAKCTGCKVCIAQLGCPALRSAEDKVAFDVGLCTGCGLCAQVCPFGAIEVAAQ